MAVRDDPQEIITAMKFLAQQVSLVVCTGGLGPTVDDLTLTTAAHFFDETIHISTQHQAKLQELFERKDRKMRPEHLKMVQTISNGTLLENPVGIALGCAYRQKFSSKSPACAWIFLPGVPSEMKGMLEQSAKPWLLSQADLLPTTPAQFFSFRVFGMVESDVNQKVQKIPVEYFEILDKPGHVFVRVPLKTEPHCYELADIKPKIDQIFGSYLLPDQFANIENYAVHLLTKHHLKLSLAESCTGGALSSLLLGAPGASEVVELNLVTYANAAKEKFLHVNPEVLNTKGAVSPETAYEMAKGALNLMPADISISVTGIAGPAGGTADKPVGTVFVAISDRKLNSTQVKQFFYPTSREEFKKRVSQVSLQWLLLHLIKTYEEA